MRAIDALDPPLPRAVALAGPARPSTRRRPISSPTSTRRRASTTRSARSTSASSATCRGRSTRTPRSSSSIPTTCRRSRGSTSSTSSAENWAELLVGAHARERDDRRRRTRRSASSTGSRSSTRSTSTTCRAPSSSTASILQRQPDHEPTLAGPRGPQGRRQGSARRRARCSSRSTRRRATGRSSFASTRCRSAARPIPSRRSSCCIASRASTRTRSETTRSAFETYARALPIDDGNEQTLGNLERLAMVVNRWADVAQLYDAQLDKLAQRDDIGSASSSSGCATPRSSRCSSRTWTARSPATAASLDGRPREPDGHPCARSPLRADRALGGARQRPGARGRDRRSRPTRSSSSSTGSARSSRRRLGDLDGAHRGLPRRHRRGARAPGDARSPRGASSQRA